MFDALNASGFRQTAWVCPLASYAIIAEHFLRRKREIPAFFHAVIADAVAHTRIAPPPGMTAERAAWGSLFVGNGAPWDSNQAFHSVKWLHENSTQPAFVEARGAFDLEWVPEPFDEHQDFAQHTSAKPWLACVAHQDPPAPDVVHCVCIGDDGNGFFRIETSFAADDQDYEKNGAQRIASWETLGKRRLDALLVKPKVPFPT